MYIYMNKSSKEKKNVQYIIGGLYVDDFLHFSY